MRAVLQRVKSASVRNEGSELARIRGGLLVLAAFNKCDSEEILQWMARKIASLRIFEDSDGKMSLDLQAVEGELLIVSQFTLYGDCSKGKRPSFEKSASAEMAEVLYDRFLEILSEVAPCEVKTGFFQEHMEVELVNDGPVTIILEKETI
ncbi:MAG: D-aminoacyl-tRNA deacylase [Candidatus Krumholzibacteria bacterium]|nr:D-aminoacyl-tRNA deacylase [Candidatus Krumholzibacteria bacterium]